MAEQVKDILELVERLAPKDYAMSWDNIGLQIGSEDDIVKRVMVTLEVTKAVMEEAIHQDVQMVISHHPLIFSSLKNILKDDIKGNLVYQAIKNNINIYAAHTNIDIATGGLNDYLANQLDLIDLKVLEPTAKEELYKLVVFIPRGHEKAVMEALGEQGAGYIGQYSHCTFRTEGVGTFKPLEGTNPFIGKQGELENVEEIRLETIFLKSQKSSLLDALLKSHPYEEVAYDIYPLINEGKALGIGRTGKLITPISLEEFIKKIKAKLNIDKIKAVGNIEEKVEKIALINGSGAEFIKLAFNKGCDCVVTGDVKYHDAQDAKELGMKVIDIGHFDSEKGFVDFMTNYLKAESSINGYDVEIIPTTVNINPFKIL